MRETHYKPNAEEIEKFIGYINNFDEEGPGCWEWTGAKLGTGYGRVHFKDGGKYRQFSTHRIAYEIWCGPIPKGMQIDHLCRNKCCCRPTHLEAVTPKENTNRSIPFQNRRRSICPHGHDISTDDKVYLSGGKRYCAECTKAKVRKYQRTPEYRERRNALRRKSNGM